MHVLLGLLILLAVNATPQPAERRRELAHGP
jgi:hypothetical protein